MSARRVPALCLAVVAALILAGCTGSSGGPGAGAGGIVEYPADQRKPAPDVRGELLGGGSYALADRRGDVVVVNFWASWCGPCRVEIVDLERVYQSTKDNRVSFVGINTRDSRDKAVEFIAARGATYPSIFEPTGRVALQFPDVPTTLPATLVIDRLGRIAALIRVSIKDSELRPIVDRIAAEAG